MCSLHLSTVSKVLKGGLLRLIFNKVEGTEDCGVGEELLEGPGCNGCQAQVVRWLVLVVSVISSRSWGACPIVSDPISEAVYNVKEVAPVACILD